MADSENKGRLRRFLNNEFWGMVLTLFSAFVLFCLFGGGSIFYPFGYKVQTFMLGALGFFSYPLFIAVLCSGGMIIFGKKISRGKSSLIASMLGVLLFAVFCIVHLASTQVVGSFKEYVSACYNSANGGVFSSTFGGALFAMPVYGLTKLISPFGAYVFFSAVIVLALVN